MGSGTCIDCKFYKAGKDERNDLCLHNRSEYGGVRKLERYSCESMRAGICTLGKLFEPSTEKVAA